MALLEDLDRFLVTAAFFLVVMRLAVSTLLPSDDAEGAAAVDDDAWAAPLADDDDFIDVVPRDAGANPAS